jgi:hypothetical protein
MEATVNTNNDNIMSSSVEQANSKPNRQASHSQFNDYICSSGTGERFGVPDTEILNNVLLNFCVRNFLKNKTRVSRHRLFLRI